MVHDERPSPTGTEPAAQERGRGGRVAAARMCALSRRELPLGELIRFVAAPDGTVVPDLQSKLPGRGVHLEGHRAVLIAAIKRGLFQRSLKAQVTVQADLPDCVDRLLMSAARQSLSLARKAGKVVTGFQKVEASITSRTAAVLIHAAEARPDGKDKLDRKFRALCAAAARPAPIVSIFASDELSLAIGGENVIHAAIAEGGLARAFLQSSVRALRYRTSDRDAAFTTVSGSTAVGIDPWPLPAGNERRTESEQAGTNTKE